jgi:hypothetical protein
MCCVAIMVTNHTLAESSIHWIQSKRDYKPYLRISLARKTSYPQIQMGDPAQPGGEG